MDQLSLLAPAIVALLVAAASVVYLHAKRPRHAPSPPEAEAEKSQLPFDFTAPTVPMDPEGTVRSQVRRAEAVH